VSTQLSAKAPTANPTFTGTANFAAISATGQVSAASFNSTSDYRKKRDVVTLDERYSVDEMRPVSFVFTEPAGLPSIGFIAHELQALYPELVSGEKDAPDMQSVNYSGVIGILVAEIQRLKARAALTDAALARMEAAISAFTV
jgi:hypothetical protein